MSRVVSTPSAIQAVFKDSDQHSKAKDMGSGYLMSQILGQCVGLLNGATWRAVRKKVDPPFMHSGATTLIPKMIEMTEDHLQALFSSRPQNYEQLDPVADLLMLPFYMIATVFYGNLTDDQVKWLNEWTPKREKLFAYALGGGLPRFWFSKYLPTEANRALIQWKDVWTQFNVEAYNVAKSRNGNVLFVRMWEDTEAEGGMTREQV
jgi:cytochrome P450